MFDFYIQVAEKLGCSFQKLVYSCCQLRTDSNNFHLHQSVVFTRMQMI